MHFFLHWWKQHETIKCTQQDKAYRKAPVKVITMNVSGENINMIFELFTNKLVFTESVSEG